MIAAIEVKWWWLVAELDVVVGGLAMTYMCRGFENVIMKEVVE